MLAAFIKKSAKEIGVALAALVLLFVGAQSADCVSNVVLSGSVGDWAVISHGDPASCSLTNAPGIFDAGAVFNVNEAADGFTDRINYGTITNGNGTNSTANIALRQRGNGPCHVSCSVSSFTANNIAYNGSPLTGLGTQLGFVRIGSGAVTAGARGNTTGFSYGGRFTSGTDTLATLNNGVIAAVNGSKDKFVSFTQAPSQNGNSTHPQNWVQDVVTFSVPTGWIWSVPNPGFASNWSVTVQFGIYGGP
jgi:hypothetical protein